MERPHNCPVFDGTVTGTVVSSMIVPRDSQPLPLQDLATLSKISAHGHSSPEDSGTHHRRLVRNRLPPEVDAYKCTHAHRVVHRFLDGWIRQVESIGSRSVRSIRSSPKAGRPPAGVTFG
jgi:hypothetical protein